jgi:NitT/TauT family transport system substrate-binding protein
MSADGAQASGGRRSRRRFFEDAGRPVLTAAGATLLAGCRINPAEPVRLDGDLETTRLRVVQTPSMCQSPLYVAQDLLRQEGFSDLEYVKKSGPSWNGRAVANGEADLSTHFAGPVLLQLEAGDPLVILAGAHIGCFELFGTDRVHAIRDLKGKTVAVPELGGPGHVFLASMLAHVGLDPGADVTWSTHEPAEAIRLLGEGRVDAYLGFAPDPQEMRARRIGHAVVNSLVDRPWSQYFCCMVIANREFVRRHPVATARALRAVLAGLDLAGRDPAAAARFLVDRGYTTQYEAIRDAVGTIHGGGWRAEHDPEDTLRYYALRLHEAGMLRSSPQQLIARGTDWRFLAEVRRARAAAPDAAPFAAGPASAALCPVTAVAGPPDAGPAG